MPRINREHILQVQIKKWVRGAVDAPHVFLAFDRSKAAGQWTHMMEKARGVQAGTPDTLLCVLGAPIFWCELKAPGNKPTAAQEALGRSLVFAGCGWFWTTTVTHYWKALSEHGVPLRPNAEYQALQADAAVASLIAKAEARAPKAKRAPRKAGPRCVAPKRMRDAGLI